MNATIIRQRLGLGDDPSLTDQLVADAQGAVSFIQDKAKAGAESAIPEIQTQVKATVTPYVYAALALGLGGFLFGLSAYMAVRKSKGLSGGRSTRASREEIEEGVDYHEQWADDSSGNRWWGRNRPRRGPEMAAYRRQRARVESSRRRRAA